MFRFKRSGTGYVVLGTNPRVLGFVRQQVVIAGGRQCVRWVAYLPPLKEVEGLAFATRRLAAEALESYAASAERMPCRRCGLEPAQQFSTVGQLCRLEGVPLDYNGPTSPEYRTWLAGMD